MAAAKSKPGLSPKLLAVVALLLLVGYLFYKHTATAQAAYSGAPGPSGSQATSAQDQGASSDQGSATADLLSALGAQNAQLLAGFQQSEQTFAQAVFGQASGSSANSTSTSAYTGGSGSLSDTSVYSGEPISGPAAGVYGSTQPYTIGGPSQVAPPNVFGNPSTPFSSPTVATTYTTGSIPTPGKTYAA